MYNDDYDWVGTSTEIPQYVLDMYCIIRCVYQTTIRINMFKNYGYSSCHYGIRSFVRKMICAPTSTSTSGEVV